GAQHAGRHELREDGYAADAADGRRGQGDPSPDQARRAEVQGRVHEGRGGARHGRPVHRPPRCRRRGESRAQQGEGARVDLRPRDPGGARLPADRKTSEVEMAKKIKAVVKVQIQAGKATAAPPAAWAWRSPARLVRPDQGITDARPSTDGGISRLIADAVFALTTSSRRVGLSMARSPGRVPRRMPPTYVAAVR